MTNERQILRKLYLLAAFIVLLAGLVVYNLLDIQFVEGDNYKELAQERVYRNFTIPANRGSLYDANQNLLATSVPQYNIRFDAVTVSTKNFEKYIAPLSKKLANLLGNTPAHYTKKLRQARARDNRYLLIAKELGYSQYAKIREFPLFKLGPYRGGFIAEQSTVRELPLGKIGKRTVGYGQAGLEGAYDYYLEGKDGRRLKQKISKGQWKPIRDANEVEPEDGLDVISTIDVNIQDIAHHALLGQLEKFEADHGTVVVMENETGAIKAMANLGRTESGKYYEKRNYAIWESHEPGSTFKLMSMVAALEDNAVDTSQVFDTEDGTVDYYDRTVRDSHRGGYGKISAAKAFEVSSNTAFSKIIYQGYKNNPEEFVNRLESMGLGKKIGLEINGEGSPHIPHPGDDNWYGTTLPWLSFGYGVTLTPLQTLAFYNAIANDGIMVKPRLIKAVRDRNKVIKKMDQPVVKNSICSKETARKMQTIMSNTVKRGTASGIYSPKFSMAGKTGTCLTGYGKNNKKPEYLASFAGYFPAENPKYSCIVVISKPNTSIGFYGSQVAAPVFKRITHKVYSTTPVTDTLSDIKPDYANLKENYTAYFDSEHELKQIPKVTGMPAMDAVSLLENLGLKVRLHGTGTVKSQSVNPGRSIKEGTKISLKTI